MIVTPRAENVMDVLRKEGDGYINIDEVLLYRRAGAGAPYREIIYWKRGTDSPHQPPPKDKSFAIVPEMTAAVHKGYGITGNTLHDSSAVTAWKAFDRNVQTSGSFGNDQPNGNGNNKYAWVMVSFPEIRHVESFAVRFEGSPAKAWMAVEGKMPDGTWTRIFESSENLVNFGWYGAVTIPMYCTAVRLLTDLSNAVQSCQFFEAVPLVPVSMTSNTAPPSAGVQLISDPANQNLYRCSTYQVNAYTHGTLAWYFSGGSENWRSNRGGVSTKDQNRFFIHLSGQATVCGFSVGGIASYSGSYCYADCLLIEGRKSEADIWIPIAEVEFDPADRRTRYFDFAVNWTVSQIRVTVQDVTHGTGAAHNASVYLPPVQVYGNLVLKDDPPPPPPPPSPYIGLSVPLVQTMEQSGSPISEEPDSESLVLALTRIQHNTGGNYV